MFKTKPIALIIGVLIMSSAIGYFIFAWQEPTKAPPQGNVPSPINVGPASQSKEGIISAPAFYDRDNMLFYINPSGQSVFSTICMGSACRTSWPETGIVTTYQMTTSSYIVSPYYYAGRVSYSCPAGSDVVNIQISQNMTSVGGVIWAPESGCTGPYPYNQENVCKYSISGSTITLEAKVIEVTTGGMYGTCRDGRAFVSSCYPRSLDPWAITKAQCELGPNPCKIEFQCGIKQTVGQ